MKTILVGVLALVPVSALAQSDSAIIESKTFLPGQTACTVAVTIQNDHYISWFSIPLEIRSVSGGAYISSGLQVDPNPDGRFALSAPDIGGEAVCPTPAANTCSGPVSQTYTTAGLLDYVSPDAIYRRYYYQSGCHPPGRDIWPSYLITFNVGPAEGIFEIDTCCIAGQHLLWQNSGACDVSDFVPGFVKGVITVAAPPICNQVPDDINCDGVVDIFDVVSLVDVAFRNAPPRAPCCR